MEYFKSISIIAGLIIVGVRPFMHLIPQKWNDFELNKLYKERKPKYILPLGLLNLGGVIFTWYVEATTKVPYSILVTIVISSTLLVVWNLFFNYYNFRKLVRKLLIEDRNLLVKINVLFSILGLCLLFLGFFIY